MTSAQAAFIAGGASGVGLEVARLLARRGTSIAIFDRSGPPLDAAVDELLGAGIDAIACEGDLGAGGGVEDAVRSAAERLGGLTAVVAAAAVDLAGDVVDMTDDAWARCVDLNLTGTFRLARCALPHLAQGGSFTAVVSTAGVHGMEDHPAYAAATHGVVGLIKSMAMDHGSRGVRCNVVCHGPLESATPALGTEDATHREWATRLSRIALGRPVRSAEVAAAVAHLASDAASYTSGAVQMVDGGVSGSLQARAIWDAT